MPSVKFLVEGDNIWFSSFYLSPLMSSRDILEIKIFLTILTVGWKVSLCSHDCE